ncbi:hypothetical protein D3C76_534500 [compost metagenome]
MRVEYKATLATLYTLLDVNAEPESVEPRTHFFRSLRDMSPKAYNIHVFAIDPTDDTNRRDFEGTAKIVSQHGLLS